MGKYEMLKNSTFNISDLTKKHKKIVPYTLGINMTIKKGEGGNIFRKYIGWKNKF